MLTTTVTVAVTVVIFVLATFAACLKTREIVKQFFINVAMLREQLVNACSGMILDAVRSQRGWLNFVSTESQVNRKYYNRKKFQTLKFFRVIRVLYVLAMKMDRDEFSKLGQNLFAEIWDEQDYLGYDLLDEYKNMGKG